jgi:hypothetical protein
VLRTEPVEEMVKEEMMMVRDEREYERVVGRYGMESLLEIRPIKVGGETERRVRDRRVEYVRDRRVEYKKRREVKHFAVVTACRRRLLMRYLDTMIVKILLEVIRRHHGEQRE